MDKSSSKKKAGKRPSDFETTSKSDQDTLNGKMDSGADEQSDTKPQTGESEDMSNDVSAKPKPKKKRRRKPKLGKDKKEFEKESLENTDSEKRMRDESNTADEGVMGGLPNKQDPVVIVETVPYEPKSSLVEVMPGETKRELLQRLVNDQGITIQEAKLIADGLTFTGTMNAAGIPDDPEDVPNYILDNHKASQIESTTSSSLFAGHRIPEIKYGGLPKTTMFVRDKDDILMKWVPQLNKSNEVFTSTYELAMYVIHEAVNLAVEGLIIPAGLKVVGVNGVASWVDPSIGGIDLNTLMVDSEYILPADERARAYVIGLSYGGKDRLNNSRQANILVDPTIYPLQHSNMMFARNMLVDPFVNEPIYRGLTNLLFGINREPYTSSYYQDEKVWRNVGIYGLLKSYPTILTSIIGDIRRAIDPQLLLMFNVDATRISDLTVALQTSSTRSTITKKFIGEVKGIGSDAAISFWHSLMLGLLTSDVTQFILEMGTSSTSLLHTVSFMVLSYLIPEDMLLESDRVLGWKLALDVLTNANLPWTSSTIAGLIVDYQGYINQRLTNFIQGSFVRRGAGGVTPQYLNLYGDTANNVFLSIFNNPFGSINGIINEIEGIFGDLAGYYTVARNRNQRAGGALNPSMRHANDLRYYQNAIQVLVEFNNANIDQLEYRMYDIYMNICSNTMWHLNYGVLNRVDFANRVTLDVNSCFVGLLGAVPIRRNIYYNYIDDFYGWNKLNFVISFARVVFSSIEFICINAGLSVRTSAHIEILRNIIAPYSPFLDMVLGLFKSSLPVLDQELLNFLRVPEFDPDIHSWYDYNFNYVVNNPLRFGFNRSFVYGMRKIVTEGNFVFDELNNGLLPLSRYDEASLIVAADTAPFVITMRSVERRERNVEFSLPVRYIESFGKLATNDVPDYKHIAESIMENVGYPPMVVHLNYEDRGDSTYKLRFPEAKDRMVGLTSRLNTQLNIPITWIIGRHAPIKFVLKPYQTMRDQWLVYKPTDTYDVEDITVKRVIERYRTY